MTQLPTPDKLTYCSNLDLWGIELVTASDGTVTQIPRLLERTSSTCVQRLRSNDPQLSGPSLKAA